MSDVKWFHSTPPPKLPGEYIIRGKDGDIVYWGESTNLYRVWCKKSKTDPKSQQFEHKLYSSNESNTCQMSEKNRKESKYE